MKSLRKIILVLVAALAMNLRAADLMKLSGSVVDAQGKPVADAEVDCYQFSALSGSDLPDAETFQHAASDNSGAFNLSVPKSVVMLVAKKSGFAPTWKILQTIPDKPLEALVLTTPSTLVGIVVDEKDQPLANAEVSVSMAVGKAGTEMGHQADYLFGKVASELFSARTTADGRFRIADFPPDAQANLAVNSPGRALRPLGVSSGMQLQVRAGRENIRIVMDPAGNIEGKVLRRDTGAPIANAQIRLRSSDGGGAVMPRAVQSGADGSFRISDLAAGTYHINALFTNRPIAPWVSDSQPVTVAAGETLHDLKVEVFKGGVAKVTVVQKSDQKALADVSVNVYGENYQANSITGADGTAWIHLPPGPFTLYTFLQGMSQSQNPITVADGETNQVQIALSPSPKITGVIRDSAGAPVANTSIGVFPNFSGNNPGSRSDASGHYEVSWQKPEWAGAQNQVFYVVAQNAERHLAALHELGDKTSSLDLELRPSLNLSARVQDAKGNAISNATAYFSLQMDNMTFSFAGMIPADDQGRVHLDNAPGEQRYSVTFTASGFGSANKSMDSSDIKSDHYDFPLVVLNLANRKVAGRVIGTNGQPAVGIRIWMNGEGQPSGNAMTDANGRFSFDTCDGALTLSANGNGMYGTAETKGGDTNVVIRFNSNSRVYSQMNSLTISGTVYDASGNPAAGARVSVSPSWGMVDNAVTEADGGYSVHWQDQPGMRNPKYVVLARDVDRNLAGIESIDAKTTHASIRMSPGISISGIVLDANGVPIPLANVNLNMMIGNMGGMVDRRPVRAGDDGTFTIPALPPGQQYNVYISASGYGSGRRSVSRTQSQSNSIQLAAVRLRTADREIAGQVLDEGGAPAVGAWVNINGNGQPSAGIRSDADGRFKFKVCSGPINVSAFSQQATTRNTYANVRARAGDMDVVLQFGVPQERQPAARDELKPQPWTFASLMMWPGSHKKAVIVLVFLQGLLLAGAGIGVFRTTRSRKS